MRNWIDLLSETYIPDDLAEYASGYMRGMGASSHPDAIQHESKYDWRFEPNYPISNLNPEVDFREWMLEEIEMWAEEGQPDRYEEEINSPIEEPIIVVEIDGVGQIIDGWHRTGGSVLAGRTTIPAVVGILKKPLEEDYKLSAPSLYQALFQHIKQQIDPEITKSEVMNAVKEVKSNLKSGMLIYRALGWDELADLSGDELHKAIEDKLDINSLGLYWTWDRGCALVGGVIGGGAFDGREGQIVLTARINLKQIDLLSTLYQNVTVFQEEKEVRLYPNTPIKIIDMNIELPNLKTPLIGNTGNDGSNDRQAIIDDLLRALK